MASIFIKKINKNAERLAEELAGVTGYLSLSTEPSGVRVYFDNTANVTQIQAVVDAHDASNLSTRQQQLENLRTEIQSLKSQVGNIDNLTAQEATAAIKLLYKVLRINDLI